MKYIIKTKYNQPEGVVTIDKFDMMFQCMDTKEVYDMYIPYSKLFKEIHITNYTSLPAELISRLTNQYLHGAEIIFETSKLGFKESYKVSKPRKMVSYSWQPFSLRDPIPKSLAYYHITYENKPTTYLEAVKTLKTDKFIPPELWKALDEYSQARIKTCQEYNKGNYTLAELWYKQLMKDCDKAGIRMYSPNKKTYFEVKAEEKFEFDKEILREGLRPLNETELTFLRKYAPAYGVEIPKFVYRINSRKTIHGYTEEPERIKSVNDTDWDKVIYDARNENNLPKAVRQGLVAKSYDNQKLLRDAYFHLLYIMKNLKDEGLMPGWKRCPVCHQIYRETEGCECGACQPITYVQANNLFYGTEAEYEDYEATRDIYEHYEEYED